MPDFSILTVCSGNIIRSPLAALILQRDLAQPPAFSVSSAGTFAGDGDAMTAEAAELATEIGVDPTVHRARYLVESYVESADLLLGLSRAHRRVIVEMVPRKVNVTFTLREFSRLAATLSDDEVRAATSALVTPRERLVAAVRLVTAARGATGAIENPADDDVIDPHRRSAEVYRESLNQLSPAAVATARLLNLAAANSPIGSQILH